jgi:hypothetical protein
VKENEFSIHSQGTHVTYQHGTGRSQIDYFLCIDNSIIHNFTVLDHILSNTSSHTGIKCNILLEHTLITCSEANIKKFRSQWDKCNELVFRKRVSENIVTPVINTPSEIDKAITNIQNVLLEAEKKSVPRKLVRL